VFSVFNVRELAFRSLTYHLISYTHW